MYVLTSDGSIGTAPAGREQESKVGAKVEGTTVGDDGAKLGVREGAELGARVGLPLGRYVGGTVGITVGLYRVLLVGLTEGAVVGATVA